MRLRTLIGLLLFVAGFATLVVSFVIGDVLPPERYETRVRDVLERIAERLDDQIAMATLRLQSGLDPDEDALPLHNGMVGQELLDAVGLGRTDMVDRFNHVSFAHIRLDDYLPIQKRYRLSYDGDAVRDVALCRTPVTLSANGKWIDSTTRRAASLLWVILAMAAGGLAITALGLWMLLDTILMRTLVADMLASSISGIVGLTVVLFLGASLQFIDRFSFLGPWFFLESVPMLIRQVLPYTIAFGVLAGVTMVYGRMANAREELILQFNGVRLTVLIVPALIVGVLFTGITFHASHFLAPEGAWQQDRLKFRVLSASLDNLPSGSFAFGHESLPFAMAYHERDSGGVLHGLTLMSIAEDKKNRSYQPRAVFCARRGRVIWSNALSQVRFELEDCAGIMWRDWPPKQVPRSFFAASLTVTQTVFSSERSQARMANAGGDGSTANLSLAPPSTGILSDDRRAKTETMQGLYRGIERAHLDLDYARRRQSAHEVADRQRQEELRRIRREQVERLFAMLSPDQRRQMAVSPELERENEPLTRATLKSATDRAKLDAGVVGRVLESLGPLLDRARRVLDEKPPPEPGKRELDPALWEATEIWRRWSVAMAPLLFVFVALPLGLLIRQGNLLVAFMSAVVLVVITWFLPLTNAERMARSRDFAPEVVMLGPALAVGLTALVLFGLAFRGGLFRLRSRRSSGGTDPRDDQPAADLVKTLVRDKPKPARSKTMTLPKAHRKAPRAKRTPAAPGATSNPLSSSASAVTFLPSKPQVRRRLIPLWLREGADRVRTAVFGGTIERHVLRGTLVSLGAAFLTIITLFVVADVMTNADWFQEMASTRGDTTTYQELAWAYYSARVPQIMYMVGPLITLFALAFTLTRIVRSNEYLVLQASGVSTWRVLRPMMLVAGAVSLAMLAYNEWGGPWWAQQMRESGTYMERNAEVKNRVVTDTAGRIVWIERWRTREFKGQSMMMIGWEQDEWPPHLLVAWPTTWRASRGWGAEKWQEFTLKIRNFEGEEVHLIDLIDPAVAAAHANAPPGTYPGEQLLLIQPTEGDTGTLRTTLDPDDINKRVTQVLEDLSISQLWELSRERPEWNAPQVMIHRSLIYPLSNLFLFLVGMPLVLRVASRSAWHGTGLNLLIGVMFYGALISLTGFGLYTTSISPGMVLWVGISPFIIAGIWLFRETVV